MTSIMGTECFENLRTSNASSDSETTTDEDICTFDAHESADAEEDTLMQHIEFSALSLFDTFESSAAQDVWKHMRDHYNFDLVELHKTLPDFNDYKRIALTNYLRKRQMVLQPSSDGRSAPSPKSEFCHPELQGKSLVEKLPELEYEWNCETYMVPTKANDRLLWELPENYSAYFSDTEDEDDDAAETGGSIGTNMFRARQEMTPADVDAKLEEIMQAKGLTHSSASSVQDAPADNRGSRKNHRILLDTLSSRECQKKTDKHEIEEQEKDYFASYSRLDIHRKMILDFSRTSAYRDFILAARDVFKGKVVLDVGCGSGILSMFCAEAMARLVVGVDAVGATLNLARTLCSDNGFSESQIQLIEAKLEEVDLWFDSSSRTRVITTPRSPDKTTRCPPFPGAEPFKCDIIVSEWMGYALLYESMLFTVLDARERFLIPPSQGGFLVPATVRMELWPANLGTDIHSHLNVWNSPLYGFDLHRLKPDEKKFLCEPQVYTVDAKALVPLDPHPTTLFDLDLLSVSASEVRTLRRSFSLTCQPSVTSLVMSFSCLFRVPAFYGPTYESIVSSLKTDPISPPTHWHHTTCHILPKAEPLSLACSCERNVQGPYNAVTLSGWFTLAPAKAHSRYLSIILELDPIHFKRDADAPTVDSQGHTCLTSRLLRVYQLN